MKSYITVLLVSILFSCQMVYADNANIMGEVIDGIGRTDTNFESYEPSYFGFVTSHSNSEYRGDVKFKLSMKYKLLQDYPVYFGYTQKSYWNISEESAPFRESNYAPEFFIKKALKYEYMPNIQVGLWRHESTGESGAESRGWNTSYIEPTFCYNFSTNQCSNDKSSPGKYIFIQPRISVFALFGSKVDRAPDNQDIFDYYGNFSTKITYVHDKDWQLFVDARVNNDFTKSGVEVKIDIGSHLLPFVSEDSTLKIFVQGWSGYGETLKNYNNHTRAVVIGVSVVR